MKGKRILAVLLAAVLLVTSAAAAGSSFSDVNDRETAVSADVLRLMGVVNGSGDNRFSPEDVLTRAQFCTMAIRFLGREKEVRSYEKRTIFTDVDSRHWARGYVNLASSVMVGDGSTRLIAGVGNGKFLPDDPISYAQAVTIVLRMVGYGDDKAGAVWPQGYLDLAAALSLGSSIHAAAGASVTRAQAARLFTDLLRTVTPSGQKYYASLGTVLENVILFSFDEKAGTVLTSRGVFSAAVEDAAPIALEGHRGTLVTGDKNEVILFLPEASVTEEKIVLRSDATSRKITAESGDAYTVAANTPVIVDGAADVYSSAYAGLKAGMEISLYWEEGKLSCLGWITEKAAFVPEEAQVADSSPSQQDFTRLTAGDEGYTVKKDGVTIGFEDIRQYDSVTYDPDRKVLTVSDLRLPCVYEEAFPSPDAPETITVLGHKFRVLDGAEETIRQYKIGEPVTLLLTAEGFVAGMAPADVGGTALGLADVSGVTVELPNGEQFRLPGTVEARYAGALVRVSIDKSGKLALSKVSQRIVHGDLNRVSMTLGEYRLTENVRVYESYENTLVHRTTLAALSGDVISKDKVISYELNNAGFVDTVLVDSMTGDVYTYGMLKRTTVNGYGGGMEATNTALTVTNGTGTMMLICAKNVENGTFGGLVAGSRDILGTNMAGDVVLLKAVEGVSRKDFFQNEGRWFVNADGAVYPVADEIHGYIRSTGKWFSQDLTTIRNYSDDMVIYVDPVGQRVRIIEV